MALNETYLEIFGFYGSPSQKVPDPCSIAILWRQEVQVERDTRLSIS